MDIVNVEQAVQSSPFGKAPKQSVATFNSPDHSHPHQPPQPKHAPCESYRNPSFIDTIHCMSSVVVYYS